MNKNKGLIRTVAVFVVSALILIAIGTGYYLVQRTQTTQSSADSNLCPQKGFLPTDEGGGCPTGSEVVNTTITVQDDGGGTGTDAGVIGDGDAKTGDTNTPVSREIQIQCCRPIVIEEPPTNTPIPVVPTDKPTDTPTPTPEPGVPTDEPEIPTDTPPTVIPDEPTKGPSCPAIPPLNVEVTCLDCIERAE